MLELMLIFAICQKIAALLKKKGRRPTGFIVLFVVLWIGGEVIGAVVGTLVALAQDPRAVDTGLNFTAYVFALLGAAIGGGVGYAIAANAAPQQTPLDLIILDEPEPRNRAEASAAGSTGIQSQPPRPVT